MGPKMYKVSKIRNTRKLLLKDLYHSQRMMSEAEDIKWNISRKLLFLLASSVQMSAHKSRGEMSGDLTSGLNEKKKISL